MSDHPTDIKTQVLKRKCAGYVVYRIRVAMTDVGLGSCYPTWNDDWINRIASMDDATAQQAEIDKAVVSLKQSIDNHDSGDRRYATNVFM